MAYNAKLDPPPLAGNERILTNSPRGYTTTQEIANLANGSSGGGNALILSSATANASLGTLPVNGFLLYLLLRETAGHAVSISIGTTSGASDVLAAQPVPASGTLTVAITAFSLGWFSATATQALFITSASWNSASINASLVFQVGP